MSGRPIDAVLARLKKLKRRSENSWHDDRNPSLSVSVGDDGRVLLNCFSGCSSDAVRAALGLEWRDLYAEPVEDVPRGTRSPRAAQGTPRAETAAAAIEPPPTGRVFASLDEVRDAYRRQLGEPSATWHYRDAGGDALGEVLRWETKTGEAETGKTIRPARPAQRTGHAIRAPARPVRRRTSSPRNS